jgi:ribosomal protein S18 acetylase RimI-like enzyme
MAYNMRLQPTIRGILEMTAEETEEGLLLQTFRNGSLVGTVRIYMEHNVATIHGVEIDAKFRGRHFGVETVLMTVDYLKKHDCGKIILHVSGANKVAYHLYSHHGFVHIDQLDYWIKSV